MSRESSSSRARTPTTVFAALFGVLALVACGESKKQQAAPPPPTVLVAPVARRDVPLYIETVSTIDGYVNADIRARVRGYLEKQTYKDGSYVKAGATLFTIERTEYTAALASAHAALARALAAQDHNRVQAERDEGLFKTGVVSRQDLDNALTSVADAQGQVQAARAQVQQAQLNLSYTTIKSPIDGIAGIALVRIGNLVGQDGPTLLTTVSQVDPIRATFPMVEADYVKSPYRAKSLDGRDLAWAQKQFSKLDASGATADGEPGVELVLSDGSVYEHRGVVVAVNRQIDPSTGTISLQALFPNPKLDLRPGQYGRVRIRRTDAGIGALTVSEKALISVQGTFSVAVVGPDNKVHLKRVELGPASGGVRVVSSGVNEGDRVVVEGVQKVSDGAPVTPKEAPPPTAAAEPASPATSGKN
ncbi:MAG TPA: efflux RND transporter periplasmic adaptor subunit [Polyangiaceae bacterium]|nr:efflux RND transporter periplasmic adaptor subunit [Polyangiaceae bacterium]